MNTNKEVKLVAINEIWQLVLGFGFSCFMYGIFIMGLTVGKVAPLHLWLLFAGIGIASAVGVFSEYKKHTKF